MSVLVTGASGTIGRHAVEYLHNKGFELHATGRSAKPPVWFPDGCFWHQVDLSVPEEAIRVLGEVSPEKLLHLAWTTAHGQYWTSPDNLNWVAASVLLLRAFAENGGRRFVAAGTCAEYDWTRLDDGWCREASTPLTPNIFYGVAKDSFRRLAESYCDEESISFAWGRVFFLFGPGESPNRLVPSVIRSLIAGELAKTSHARQVRDFLSAVDLGQIFAELLASDVEGAINLGSGEATTLKTIIEMIRQELGGEVSYGAIEANPNEPPVLLADTTRLVDELRFRPKTSLKRRLVETIDYWRQNPSG